MFKNFRLLYLLFTRRSRINVVREAYDGDLICVGHNGLYITTKYFTHWTKLAEGEFSDLVVQQRSFFALEYGLGYIEKYSLIKEGQWQNIYKHKLLADEPKDFKLNENSTLCFSSDQFWVNSSLNQELYRFSDKGQYLQMFKKANLDPAFCQIDDKGKALIADYRSGKFHLLDMKQEEEIAVNAIWQSVRRLGVRDACFDSGNNELWIISGTETIKLIKYAENRPI